MRVWRLFAGPAETGAFCSIPAYKVLTAAIKCKLFCNGD